VIGKDVLSIMAFPRRGDSYTECFYPALESLGVKVYEGIFAGRWLLQNLRSIDYVHLHWPSFFYHDQRRTKCLRKYALFLFFLALARWRGARLIWTVHNLYPHDRCIIPPLDGLTRRLLIRMTARFAIHGPSAEGEVRRMFPAVAGRTILIDHGHYIGYYPNFITRSVARLKLGIADNDFVFLFIGLCKSYKNVEGLISAFEQLGGQPVLVIAGKFPNSKYEATIRAAVARSRARIILHPGFVPDEDIQTYLHACDIVTAPYKEVLTSGTAMLALSFGRPVIAPAVGFLKDAVTEGSGLLYDASQLDGLKHAMQSAMRAKFDESRIIEHAKAHDWRQSAQRMIEGLPCLDRSGTSRATR